MNTKTPSASDRLDPSHSSEEEAQILSTGTPGTKYRIDARKLSDASIHGGAIVVLHPIPPGEDCGHDD